MFNDFPEFMRSKANAISSSDQSKGVEGWLYESVDGKQMAYWICKQPIVSIEHTHNFDEYMVVVQGVYILVFRDREVILKKGDEYYIPKGVPHGGKGEAYTRTIHCFGGKRAEITHK